MKKNIIILLSFPLITLIWCTSSNSNIKEINPEEWFSDKWISIENSFNNQLEESSYIDDFEDFISYKILSITEDKPFSSKFSISATFDKNSSIQWWLNFSKNKLSKASNFEFSDIMFNIKTKSTTNYSEPFNLSWNVSLLYKDNEMYANLHDLDVFMWEGNVVAKMYTLLWDLIIDNRVNLEVHSWWVVSIDENENKKLPHIVWTIKNILKTENTQDSPNFIWNMAELLNIVNSYIDLWISTNGLKLVNQKISYFELSDKSIQKEFIGSFQWKDSTFDLSFISSNNWLKVHIYNTKEYDEDIQNYKDLDSEILLDIQKNKKSEYSIVFKSTKYHQNIVDIQWKIKYSDEVKFSAIFILEPLELISWQKISWNLDWYVTNKSWEFENDIPELSWNILSLSELLSSL